MNCEAIAHLNNKYHLYAPIGQGEFHATFWATECTSGKPVILKTLSPQLREHSDYDSIKQEFLNLAQRFAACEHRHLVPILDSFEEKGQPYIVYDYIPGQTLAQLIEFGLVLPQTQALRAICQIGAALCVLHNAGLQHLDINPKNIILKKDSNDVVLIDFAFPFNLIKDTFQNTLEPSSYLPPEYFSTAQNRTHATDIYSLAATLYYLLVGNPPPLPSERASGWHISHKFSPAVKMVISQGLALNPTKRPSTIKDWLSPLFSKQRPATTPVIETTRIQEEIVNKNTQLQVTEPILATTEEAVKEISIAKKQDTKTPNLQEVQATNHKEESTANATIPDAKTVELKEEEILDTPAMITTAIQDDKIKEVEIPATQNSEKENNQSVETESINATEAKENQATEVTIFESQDSETQKIEAVKTQATETIELEEKISKKVTVAKTDEPIKTENSTLNTEVIDTESIETTASKELKHQEAKLTEIPQRLETIVSNNLYAQETTITENSEILTSEAVTSKPKTSEIISEEVASFAEEEQNSKEKENDSRLEKNLIAKSPILSNIEVISQPVFSTSTSEISKNTHVFPFHFNFNLKNFTLPKLNQLEFLNVQNLKERLSLGFSSDNSHSQEEEVVSQTSATPQAKFIIGSMLVTSAISTSAGIGFGLAIRLNRPVQAGSSPLHTEQSFPPRSDWSPSEIPEPKMSKAEMSEPKVSDFPPRDNWPISNSVEINIP